MTSQGARRYVLGHALDHRYRLVPQAMFLSGNGWRGSANGRSYSRDQRVDPCNSSTGAIYRFWASWSPQ